MSKVTNFTYFLDDEYLEEENNNFNEEQNCGLCGHFDADFDEDALQMHWFRECPMVFKFNLVIPLQPM
jgi:hypothetical protein